jgi:predicted MFS family arabinose efflux permease
VTAPWQFILVYGVVIAAGFTGSGILPVSVHVSRWFPSERGFVTAVAASGFSLGHLAFTQVAAWAAALVGWRQTYLWLAAAVAGALGAFTVVLHEAPASSPARDASSGDRSSRPGLSSLDRRTALRTTAFWALTLGLVGCGFTDFLMTTHLAAHATDLGLTPGVAANAISLWAAANVLGILAAGGVAAWIGPRWALVLTYGLRAAAFFYLPLVREPWQLYLFAALFGAIFGAANLFHHSAGALGAYAGGLVFDLAGSYRPIFLIAALVVVGSAGVTLFARRDARSPARS